MHAAGNEFSRAAGRRDWSAVAEEAEAEARGAGLYEIDGSDPGRRRITNVRKLAGREPRAKGSVLIGTAGWMLAVLAAGVMAVSFAGQFTYIYAARADGDRGVNLWSLIEAGMFDTGMIVLSLLALGLARATKASRTERVLIVLCALGSAAMGYAAADVSSPRSVAAYVAPPLFLAVVVDRVISVIRRHMLGDDEPSPWAGLGRVVLAAVKLLGLVLLYTLRLVLDPKHTPGGLRRVVLNAAPLPAAPVKVIRIGADQQDELDDSHDEKRELETPGSKKARFLAAYRLHKDYGNRDLAGKVAAELAPGADLQPGSGRTYIYDELKRLAAQNGGA